MRKITIILIIIGVMAGLSAAYGQECCSKVLKAEAKVSGAEAKVVAAEVMGEAKCKCEAVKANASAEEVGSCCQSKAAAEKAESEVKAHAHMRTAEHAESVSGPAKSCECSHAGKTEEGGKAHADCKCKSKGAETEKEKK